jgi:hypothetical protein
MKKSILLFLCLQIFYNSYAQEYLAFARKRDKIGYIDITGKWVIPPIFADAKIFSEGLAAAREDNKYGYIDKRGNYILKPVYENAREFRNGLAIASMRGGWGMIDTSGANVLPYKYGYIDYFSDGFARIKNPGWAFVRKGGEVLKTVNFFRCESFRGGLARVEIKNKWGFIDTTGALVIKAEYDEAGDFIKGMAMVKKDGKAGYVNKKGVYILEPKYDKAKDFYKGIARVYMNKCWSFIDTTGKVILTLNKKIKRVSNYRGASARADVGRGAKYINSKGEFISKKKFYEARDFYSGIAIAGKPGNYLLVDTLGTLITKPIYEHLNLGQNGLYTTCRGGDWGFMDKQGKWVIKPEFTKLGILINADKKQNGDWRYMYYIMGTTIRADPNDYK